MIPFDKIPQMMRDLDISHLKISDSLKNPIYVIEEGDAESAIVKLLAVKDSICHYQRVMIKAATASQAKGNYTNAAIWTVVFSPSNTGVPIIQQPIAGAVPAGYVSEREVALKYELEKLKQEHSFDKRMEELEKKFDKKKGFNVEPWHIMATGEALGWPQERTEKYVKLLTLSNSDFSGRQVSGLAGSPEAKQAKTTVTVEGTAEEKKSQEDLEKLAQQAQGEFIAIMEKFGHEGSVTLLSKLNTLSNSVKPQIIIDLLQGLIDKPHFAETALTFIK
jgi:hypothetical protein